MTAKAVILGGGACGLAAAYDLALAGRKVIVIEADTQLGGLAKSMAWGDSLTDLGPHKLFSLDRDLINRILGLLPADQWLKHPKISSIYLNGCDLNYPPTPFDLLRALGIQDTALSAFDFALTQLPGRKEAGKTFEADAEQRAGRTLYEKLFKPLATKIWGDPRTLDAQLSRSRIQLPSVKGVLQNLLQPKKKEVTWEAKEFFYPRGGLRMLWEKMAATIQENGGEIITGDPVVQVATDGQRIQRVKTRSGRSWTLEPDDHLISTIPLRFLGKAIPDFPKEIETAIGQLRLNDLWLVFLKVREDVLGASNWIFIPDASILFQRVSGQRKFDPGMVEKDIHLICCEVMNYPGKETMTMTDDQLTQRCIQDLKTMKRLSRDAVVVDSRVVRLPSTYPVLTVGYKATLERVLGYFDRFSNLRTIGRQGAYNYIGTLDAMDTGFGLARLIIAGRDTQDWNSERKRTSFYPILD